eukprot:TRINITY_DN7451_c0_g1_i3.p1 TRINITY_DN7451_c0_g1~~TRINITY_DN7451_c0_g1_i3.p1  ORF type:complete len:516 (+),score=109.43 TRINITY_DN7451_c0_g1_i3:193-1548(+)
MLDVGWETLATTFVNCESAEFASLVRETLQKIDLKDPISTAKIFVAADTRPSSLYLKGLVCDAATLFGATVRDFELLTTGQIHWLVRQTNLGLPDSENDYFQIISRAYLNLVRSSSSHATPLLVDCANGVGSLKWSKFLEHLSGDLSVSLINNGEGILNLCCGAEHVQKGGSFPVGVVASQVQGMRCCSIDGDSDRVVYFSASKEGNLLLADGDKIATLYVKFISRLLQELGIAGKLKVGNIKTAYANGASVDYARTLVGIDTVFTPTGVKHLHKKALDFDIAVYFEANGHGTVLFNKGYHDCMSRLEETAEILSPTQRNALAQLQSLSLLLNQATGDAFCDILAVEAMLRCDGLDFEAWMDLYHELPNCLTACKVADRNMIKTSADESRALQPPGLQEAIDEIVAAYPSGRCFVRPSGTEDIVRIYAEAERSEDVSSIIEQVNAVVHRLC